MNAAKIVLFFIVAVFLALAAFAASPDFEGTWVGTAELPEHTADDIVLVLDKTGAGVMGTISDGLGIIRPETAFAGFRADGNALGFHFPAVDGLTIAFTLKARGDRLIGCWTDPDGGTGKIELVRKQ
jgi:hypothetical protein